MKGVQGTPFLMKSAASQPNEGMKSAFGLMKSGLKPLIVEFGNLPIAKQKFKFHLRIREFANTEISDRRERLH